MWGIDQDHNEFVAVKQQTIDIDLLNLMQPF